MARLILFEATPWNISDGSTATVRLAGGGKLPYSGARGFTDWRSGVQSFPTFVAAAGFSEKGWTGGAIPQTSQIVVFPSDDTLRNTLLAFHWKGSPIALRSGDDEKAPGTFILELTGVVDNVSQSEGAISFTVADLAAKLSVPAVAARFAGTGGTEGPAEAEGRAKRLTFGLVRNVEGFLLEKPNNIYEFGDPVVPLTTFLSVKDMGRTASPAPAVLAWQGSVAATFAALQASSPAAGSGVVAPSIACVKWWTKPSGPLTADIQGDVAAGSNKVADIAARLLSVGLAGVTVASGDLTTINGVRTAVSGLHIGDDSETFAQALDRLLIPVNVLWALNPDGTIRLGEIQTASAVETLTAITVERVETFKPLRQATLGYQRNYRKHSDGEISAALLSEDVASLVAVGDSNRVRLSVFEKALLGWAVGRNTAALAVTFTTYSNNGRQWLRLQGSFTANAQEVSIAQATTPGYPFPVLAGERLFVGAQVRIDTLNAGGTWALVVQYINSAGVVFTSQVVANGSGVISPEALKTAFTTVPANAIAAYFELVVASAASGSGAFDFSLAQPQVMSAGSAQTAVPAFAPGPGNEPGAEISLWITESVQRTTFRYSYTGTAEGGEFPRDLSFTLMSTAGFIVADSWKYVVLAGNVNGFTVANGEQSMSSGSTGIMTVNSLGTSEARVAIRAYYRGKLQVWNVTLTKEVAAPPSAGSGATGGTLVSINSGFSIFNSTSPTAVTPSLHGTMPAGVTTASINVAIDARPVAGVDFSTTIACRVMRFIGGVWTQIGGTFTAQSNWVAADNAGDSASFSFSVSDTGLTGGTAYDWRVEMWAGTGGRTHNVTGFPGVSVTA